MMKKIKRREYSFILMQEISDIVEELKSGSNYKVYIDLSDGEMYISRGTSKNPKYKVIGVVYAKAESTHKKFVQSATREFYKVIHNYHNSGVLICKTSAVKTYNKDFIEAQNCYCETDNPYYKCASPMKLYNKEVLDFNYGVVMQEQMEQI